MNLEMALIYAGLAGLAIPIGGAFGAMDSFREACKRVGLDHGVTAFGGGVLVSAVALILLPEGMEGRGPLFIIAGFGGGAATTLFIDRAIEMRGGAAGNVLAMLMDFVPEAIALGAVFASGAEGGPFLALLIALQNLPEGFNSLQELMANMSRSKALGLLGLAALLGPIAAWFGVAFLATRPDAVAFLFLFSAGGIVYLIFHDIAPAALQKGHWLPTTGAILGVLVGLVGESLLSQ